jgi:Na+-driven multidrug efflux pump
MVEGCNLKMKPVRLFLVGTVTVSKAFQIPNPILSMGRRHKQCVTLETSSPRTPLLRDYMAPLDSEIEFVADYNILYDDILFAGVQQQLYYTDGLSGVNLVTPLNNNSDVVVQSQPEQTTLSSDEQLQPYTLNTSSNTSQSTCLKPKTTSPGLRKIISFAIPAMGIWLCNPILSMIDTSAVGLLAGTTHQAALSPAVAVVDYSALLLAFLYTGTTNLMAASMQKDREDPKKSNTASTFITSLQLSLYIGTIYALALLVSSKTLLSMIIGAKKSSGALSSPSELVFETALKYVRIRALGMPAAAVIGSAQAACMGMQDLSSPLGILASAAVVNFLGDVLLVGSKHPWIGGAPGAAWATVFSQFAAVGLFLSWLIRNRNTVTAEDSDFFLEQSKRQSRLAVMVGAFPKWKRNKSKARRNDSQEENKVSTKGFLNGRFKRRQLFSLPSLKTSFQFLPYVVPIVTTSIGRVSSYVAMSHVVSSTFGTVSMAAQQIIVSIFYCLCPVADSLNLCAQSLVPAIFEENRKASAAVDDSNVLKKTSNDFLIAGGIFGAILAFVTSVVPFLTRFFTSDLIVVDQVKQIIPLLAAIFSVHGLIAASEGVLLGQSDLGFLGRAYAAFFFAVPWMMLRIKKQAAIKSLGLSSVWRVFVGYQLVRSALFFTRVRILADKDSSSSAETRE